MTITKFKAGGIYKLVSLMLLGVFIGLLCLKFFCLVLVLFVSILFLVFVWFKEEYAILFIIVITASIIFEEQLPAVQTGVGNFHIIDLFLFFSMASIFIKVLSKKNEQLVRTPLDIYLLVFYGFAILSLIIAVSIFSVTIRQAFSELRVITYYLVFFLVTNLIKSEQQLKRLINGLYIIALITVGFMVAQAALGTSLRLIPARVESLLTLGQTHNATIRVIAPGNSLIYVMLITACCTFSVLKSKFKYIFLAVIIVLGCGQIIGFNRNLWIPVILMLLLFFIIASRHIKIRFIGFSLIFIFGLIAFLLWANISGGKLKVYTDSTYSRLFSLTKGEQLARRGSLLDRIIENRYAYNTIKKNPILGIGLGNSYRPNVDWNPRLNSYIHNGYLWILMKMGLFAFIIFVWFIVFAIIRGFKYWKKVNDPYLKGVCIGFTLAVLGFMLSALVTPIFLQWYSTVIIGLMLGGNELIFRLQN